MARRALTMAAVGIVGSSLFQTQHDVWELDRQQPQCTGMRAIPARGVPSSSRKYHQSHSGVSQFGRAIRIGQPGVRSNPAYAYYVYNANSTNKINQNLAYSAAGYNTGYSNSSGFSYGLDNVVGTNPGFVNPVDPGAPSCGAASSVPNCMATVISHFTPTTTSVAGYGYQAPLKTQDYDPLFPQWLCNTNLPAGLVSMGCKIAP